MSASIDALPVRSDFAVISLVGFVHAVSHFFHLVIPLLFPWLMPAFDMSFTEAGALMTVFFVISGVGQAAAGLVVDRVGSRPVLFGGVVLLALSGVLLGVAQNYAMLMAAAAVAGAGNSVFHPADFTILNRRVSKPRLGHAFSVHGLSGNLGWAATPMLMTAVASPSAGGLPRSRPPLSQWFPASSSTPCKTPLKTSRRRGVMARARVVSRTYRR